MKLIVGLGNPGKEYDNTRHNAGFIAIDKIASSLNLDFSKTKFDGLYVETIINGEKIILLKPQSYINLSGEVIKKFVDFYKIPISDILILCDDMDIELGKCKLKYKGSATHNGLRNIELNLKTQEYKRVKIGISKNKNIDTINYVLGKFNNEEKEKLSIVIDKMPSLLNDFLSMNFDNLMNKYN